MDNQEDENNIDNDPNNNTETNSDQEAPTAVPDIAPDIDPIASVEKKQSKKLIFIIIIIALVSLAVGASATYFLTKSDTSTENTTINNNSEQSAQVTTISGEDQLANFLNPTTGEVWYEQPVKIDNQGWVIQEDQEQETDYYEVGTRGENKIVITAIEQLGTSIEYFEVSPTGKVTLIKEVSSTANPREEEYVDEYLKYTFVDTIAIDTDTHYDSLSIPTEGITLDSGYILEGPQVVSVSDSYEPYEGTVASDEYETYAGTIQKFVSTYEEPGLQKVWFQLKLSTGYAINLYYTPMDTDGSKFTWISGDSSVASNYSPIVRGCGVGTGVSVGFRLQDSDLVVVGKNTAGEDVYELAALDYKLLTKVVDEYNEYNSYIENFKPIDKQSLVDQHGIIFYKDSIGNWLVYTRDDLSPEGGCAKPVIYLYPETETAVSVKVGADVKISDPLYPTDGWSVLAKPNGELSVDGKKYGSLFWEGPGQGQYPGITTGKIVKTEIAISTIKSQLSELGLNNTEISDFVEYWQDKLPTKPFTRLTWLTTEELNQLAPLQITPKPDTLIRVFLDYSGLDEPYNLPQQTLTKTPRKGFTVVEWGGLSPYKLY